jgi:hypothetical protein
VGLFPKRQNLNWSGITLKKAKIKLEWDYSNPTPFGGIIPLLLGE